MFDYTLEHLFSYTATLKPPEGIGPMAEGLKLNWYVTGGEVTGPRVKGQVLPVGGDWVTIRTDGVAILDVRVTIESDDGALILMVSSGVMDLGEEGYQRALQRQLPEIIHLQSAPRFFTAHPQYRWLNRIQCVGVGKADSGNFTVSYDIYAIRP